MERSVKCCQFADGAQQSGCRPYSAQTRNFLTNPQILLLPPVLPNQEQLFQFEISLKKVFASTSDISQAERLIRSRLLIQSYVVFPVNLTSFNMT